MASTDGGNAEASSTSVDVNVDDNVIPSISYQYVNPCESTDSAGVDNSFLDMPTLERHDSVETVRYSSPVSKAFLDVGDSSFTKDVKDATAIPGACGLYNLGNTCFMNAGLVSLMSTAPLVRHMLDTFQLEDCGHHSLASQFYRLLCKIWCGQYAIIHPRDFKDALGLYHSQFQDYRQHDCQEFLALLLDSLHEHLRKNQAPPLSSPSSASHLNNTETSPTASTSLHESCPSPSPSPPASSRPSPSPPASSPPYSPHSPSCSPPPVPDHTVSSSQQSAQAAAKESSGGPAAVAVATSGCVSSTTASASPLLAHSEDSNHSSVSSQSTDSEQSAALRNKLRIQFGDVPKSADSDAAASAVSSSSDAQAKPELGKRGFGNRARFFAQPSSRVSTTTVPEAERAASPPDRVAATAPAPAAQLNNVSCPSDFCTFHDFLSKEMKTLNTNVLVSDLPDSVSVDSEKFAKLDNRCLRPQPEDVNLQQEVVAGDEDKTVKMDVADTLRAKETNFLGIKDVNVRSERKLGSKQSISTLLNLECSETVEDLNNIKRIKMDTEAEKNIQLQEFSKFNTRKSNIHCDTSAASSSQCDTSNIRVPPSEASDPESSGESMEAEDGDSSDDEDGEVTSRSSTVDDLPTTTTEANVLSQQDLHVADRCWRNYLLSNNSIITSTFQGQFRSMVTCAECGHVSVTYEPFMYLSLPIPYAMERQICVIFIPTNLPPVRYLLTLHKNDSVAKLKKELCLLIGQEICDIILAEVLDCHISRIVEDNVMLRYVNDTNRVVYAFEMPAAQPLCAELGPPTLLEQSSLPDSLTTEHWVTPPSPRSTAISPDFGCNNPGSSADFGCNNPGSSADIFSNVQTFNPETFPLHSSDLGGEETQTGDAAMSTTTDVEMQEVCDSGSSLEGKRVVLSRADPLLSLGEIHFSEVSSVGVETESSLLGSEVLDTNQSAQPESSGEVLPETGATMEGIWEWGNTADDNTTIGECWTSPVDSTTPCTPHPPSPVTSSLGMGGGGSGEEMGLGVIEQWRSCAICLEELSDSELLVHLSCNGTFCQNCLEMSVKHSGDASFSCPTCLCPTDVSTDFVPLASASAQKPKLRVMVVCLAYRHRQPDCGQLALFGHPNLVYLPNHVSCQLLHRTVAATLPCALQYSVHLTDGQGLHCSRCGYMSQCAGCEVGVDGEMELRPSDHLTVHCEAVTEEQLEAVEAVQDHSSMEGLRPNHPVTIFDCFHAFTESEVLDEHNPWYCSRCDRNQCAKKTMTVWRYPDNLIVHLKRFGFHDLSSTKVDSKVIFPRTDLDLSNFTSRSRSKSLNYDLYTFINHYGGAHSGHYTAYSRHPLTSQWFHHNDETVVPQEPREDDYSSAYVLFYQRQGSEVSFSLPNDVPAEEELTVSSSPQCAISSQPIPLPPPSLDHTPEASFFVSPILDPTPQAEPDSTLDFYS